MDIVDKIIAFEEGSMPEDQVPAFFQEIIDNGMVWNFHGFYGRMANDLIESGDCYPAGLEPFKTSGWVTCSKRGCGKQITEGLKAGAFMSEKFYCEEHYGQDTPQTR